MPKRDASRDLSSLIRGWPGPWAVRQFLSDHAGRAHRAGADTRPLHRSCLSCRRAGDVRYFLSGGATYSEDSLHAGCIDGATNDVIAYKDTSARIRSSCRAHKMIILPFHDDQAVQRMAIMQPY